MIMTKSLIEALQTRLINVFLQGDTPVGNHIMEDWDWFQGVALFGLYQYARQKEDGYIKQYLHRWFDYHLQKGLPGKNINSICPLLTLSFLYEDTQKAEYLPVLNEWLHYVMHDLPRTVEGGFQHITRDSDNEMQLWDDTLYMTVLFVARMGSLTHDDSLVQESIRQFIIHLKYLTDPVTGLFFHGWTFKGCHHFAGALWGRGNAWYTAGLVDYLELATIPAGVRMALLSALQRQAEALLSLQDEEGMWHTLLNEPEKSYAESSATAGFVYGLLKSVRLGYLSGKTFLEPAFKAASAVIRRIDKTGVLTQTSGGTCVGETLDYYRKIPLGIQPYGQSMALLMLVELEHHIGSMEERESWNASRK